MQNKLQELTDKLYSEGLSKGKQEGEEILAKARSEADAIIEKAKAEAEAIMAKARSDAEELKTKVASDVTRAANESMAATKQDIANLIVSKMTDKATNTALSEADFVKGIIKAVAEKFSAQEASDIEMVLPESLKGELQPFIEKEISSIIGKGVEARFSKKIAGGFQIGPKDGGYYISLTDETLRELIASYLRPATKKILFG